MSADRIAAGLFVVAVAPCALMYALWPMSHLFLPDDAFYYFQIAENMAAGFGSTFDRINPTNGFHPLWLLVLSLLALFQPGKELFVTLALTLQSALVAFALWTVYRTVFVKASRATAVITGLVAIGLLWNYYVSKVVISGLESALFFALAALTVRSFSKWLTDETGMTATRSAALGALAALTLLSRLDSVFYVMVILVVWLLRDFRSFGTHWKRAALFTVIPALTLAVYMALNQQLFDVWMPVSGYIKRAIHAGGPSLDSVGMFAACAVGILTASRLACRRIIPRLTEQRDVALTVVALYLLFYQADLSLVRGAVVPEIWYLSQHILWGLMVAFVLLDRIVHMRPGSLRYCLTGCAALLAMAGIAGTWAIRLQRSSYDHYLASKETAGWINANLPQDAVLAGWDVGIVGYYSRPRLINLDGLVNSFDYLQHLQRGEGIDFLDKQNVAYIVQYYGQGFELGSRYGYDWNAFRSKASLVIHKRTVSFASMDALLQGGRRRVHRYEYEVRLYQSNAGSGRAPP